MIVTIVMKNGVIKFYFLSLFWGITMISFSQKEKHIRMIYQETVCPPSWVSYDNNKESMKNLKELLSKDSIEVFGLKFTGTPFEVTCAGCQCLTGRNIEIVIKEQDMERLKRWGLNYEGYGWEKMIFKE